MFFVYHESRPCRFSFKLVFVDLIIKESAGLFLWKHKKGVSKFVKELTNTKNYRTVLLSYLSLAIISAKILTVNNLHTFQFYGYYTCQSYLWYKREKISCITLKH